MKQAIPFILLFFSVAAFGQSQNTLLKLQDKDTIVITFYSQGCFQSTSSKLVINKDGDQYIASLYKDSGYYMSIKEEAAIHNPGDSLVKKVVLTDKNIQDFTRFENELSIVKNAGCTTTDWYDVRSKYVNIKRVDGSCSWRGFYHLRESFFGDEK